MNLNDDKKSILIKNILSESQKIKEEILKAQMIFKKSMEV